MRSWASMGADAEEYILTESIELDRSNDAPRRIDAPRCISSGPFRRDVTVRCADTRRESLTIFSSFHLSGSHTLGGWRKLACRGEDGDENFGGEDMAGRGVSVLCKDAIICM